MWSIYIHLPFFTWCNQNFQGLWSLNFTFSLSGGSSTGCKSSSSVCLAAPFAFVPTEASMSSQHSHAPFSGLQSSMADHQQVTVIYCSSVFLVKMRHMQFCFAVSENLWYSFLFRDLEWSEIPNRSWYEIPEKSHRICNDIPNKFGSIRKYKSMGGVHSAFAQQCTVPV